jgi:pimeloyl-ACP methyl ester carboxylesterase
MDMFDNNGRQINWRLDAAARTADAVPVVFLHAFPFSSTMWKPQVELRERGLNVFAYDLYGFGRSAASDDPAQYSIEKLVSDLHGFLAHVVKRPAIVCGLSLGGYVTLRAALEDSTGMLGLILADIGAGSDDPEPFRKEVEEWALAYEASGVERFLENLLHDPLFGDSRTLGPDIFDAMMKSIRENPKSGVVNTARHVIAGRTPVYALEKAIMALRVPTLVMVGGNDEKCLRPAAFLARTIAGASLETFSGCGHFINVEQRERFNNLVSGFAQSAKPGS